MQVNRALTGLARGVSSLRTETGQSVIDLSQARNCGVSESTIRRIEKASRTGYAPKFSTLVKLANGLKVPVSTLIANLG